MTDKAIVAAGTDIAWAGTASQQKLAARVFEAIRLQGSFFPANVPIRQTLANLASYIATQDKADEAAVASQIDAALKANSAVFRREEDGDTVTYATTRLGYYTEPVIDDKHSFAQRLHEPENPLPIDDLNVIITRTRPALTTVEPVYISDYWQQRSPVGPSGAPAQPVQPAATQGIPAAQPEIQPEPTPNVVAEPVVAEPVVVPVAPARPAPVASTVMTLHDDVTIDLAQPVETILEQHGAQLQQAIADAIHNDPLRRIVSFGAEFYPEDNIATLSKGDLRRIREYIVEQGEPMPDTSILSDVYYKNPREADYNAFRFALNYRLNREKDFEFVGVEGARLWSAKGLPTVGTKRLKTSELGQFYAFLEESPSYDDSLSQISADDLKQTRQISRFLTFFEWEYGALPYDAAMKALLPKPLLPEQRTAVLRIESPQHYTFYLAELRYPTANRGGWLHGLEEFFKEHLVPGALITLAATEDPSVWTLAYEETAGKEAKLLQQDDKKNRYSFVKHTFYCDVDDDLVTSQERLTRLKNMKVLPSGERRRIVSTAGYVLEQVGQPRPGDASGFQLELEDLFLGVNVQRPATRAYLRESLAGEEDFLIEDNTFIYFPPPEEENAFVPVEEEEE
jgi:hypothetical protein